jgi:hypothetical protein
MNFFSLNNVRLRLLRHGNDALRRATLRHGQVREGRGNYSNNKKKSQTSLIETINYGKRKIYLKKSF